MIASQSDHRRPPSPPRAMSACPKPPVVFQTAVDEDGRVRLKISGDLDITTGPALTDQLATLADLRPAGLVIDLSGVTFLDCASARLLAGMAALLPPDQPPVLTSVRPAVRRLLELLGLPMRIAD
jgi:anti-sigma B factor antagonist